MSITPREWMALTRFKRIEILESAAEQNLMRWNKKKAPKEAANKKYPLQQFYHTTRRK
jgi:hypothetical protein